MAATASWRTLFDRKQTKGKSSLSKFIFILLPYFSLLAFFCLLPCFLSFRCVLLLALDRVEQPHSHAQPIQTTRARAHTPNRDSKKCPSSAAQPSRPPARSAPAAAMILPSPRSGPRESATPRGGCLTRAPLLPEQSGSGRAGRRRGEFGRGRERERERDDDDERDKGAIDDSFSPSPPKKNENSGTSPSSLRASPSASACERSPTAG